MKLSKITTLLALGVLVTITATGCKTKHPSVTPLHGTGQIGDNPSLPPGGTVPGTGSEAVSGTPSGIAANPPGAHDGWIPHPEVFQADTAHFDYDSSVVKAGDKPKLAAVADYLKANSADAVKVEGHCDERGTEEYNRSLGERRALALREELVRLGIDATRVDTISYGKDWPEDPGHDEAAWRKNRRGVFILLSPPK